MKFLSGSEAKMQELSGGVKRKVLVHNEDMMMVEVHFQQGGVGSVHAHPHVQATYIVSGSFEFENDGENRIVNQGDSLLFASNVTHGVVCLEAGVVLDVFSPMRKDFL